MFKGNKFTALAFCTSLLVNQAIFAAENPLTSLERIKNITKDFILTNIKVASDERLDIQFSQIDSLSSVPPCDRDILPKFPENTNAEKISSIQLTCNSEKPWTVYVPVNIEVYTKVLAANSTISSGQIIKEEDLEYQEFNKNRLYSGSYKNKMEIVGYRAMHLIPAGNLINKNNISPPIVVRKNDVVSITAISNNVSVTMKGIAKDDGSLNESIKVMNPSSKRMVDAIVVGPGKTQITV